MASKPPMSAVPSRMFATDPNPARQQTATTNLTSPAPSPPPRKKIRKMVPAINPASAAPPIERQPSSTR